MLKKEIYDEKNFLFSIEENVARAVTRVRDASVFSDSMGKGKLYVCFSGGKDSVALYGICKLAFGESLFDKCEFHYNITGIDHPELVKFIKREFPFVNRDMYKESMWSLILKNGMPPTRISRYCCKELKERGGIGRFCVTGVRWEESPRRKAHRGVLEADRKILNSDNDEDRRLLEHCIPKQKYICNPIVDWSEQTVWRFIVKENLPYCDLYDEGFNRLGCIGCPMDTRRKKVLDAYPKYKAQYIRTFDKMVRIRKEKEQKCTWTDGQSVYDWWVSR